MGAQDIVVHRLREDLAEEPCMYGHHVSGLYPERALAHQEACHFLTRKKSVVTPRITERTPVGPPAIDRIEWRRRDDGARRDRYPNLIEPRLQRDGI